MRDVFEVKEIAPPLPSEVREMKVHEVKEVEEDKKMEDDWENSHSVYGDVVHDWELSASDEE